MNLSSTYLAFLFGLLWEICILIRNPKKILMLIGFTTLMVILCSFWTRNLNLPATFATFLIISIGVFYHDKLAPQLSDWRTLLHSMAFTYWLASFHLLGCLLSLIPLLHVSIHALTTLPLSRGTRLYFSLWSTFIMAFFGMKFVKDVLSLGTVEGAWGQLETSFIFLEYFLLGASGPYIFHHLTQLMDYLPSKRQSFWSKAHQADVKKLNEEHISRYSKNRLPSKQGFFIFLSLLSLLLINLHYQFVSVSLMVWSILVIVPLLLRGSR